MSYEHDVGGLYDRLIYMPEKILHHHEVDALPQIVLHDLSHDDAFGFDKAVYLVDNPEFDCLKGVAGFSRDECKFHQANVWGDPLNFHKEMQSAPYNLKTQSFLRHGIKRSDIDMHSQDDLIELGKLLDMKNPMFLTWRMKHGNHGVLIFEIDGQNFARKKNLLKQAGPLLSLC